MTDEESEADADERIMLGHHIDEMRMDDLKDEIERLEAENKRLRMDKIAQTCQLSKTFREFDDLEEENKRLRAAIARAKDLKPRDRWEIKDAGHDYCAGIRDTLAALEDKG